MTEVFGVVRFSGINHEAKKQRFMTHPITQTIDYQQDGCNLYSIQITGTQYYIKHTEDYLFIKIGDPNEALNHMTLPLTASSLSLHREELEHAIIYIDKIKKQLFLATDLLGTSPWYYYFSDHTLFFANKQRLIMQTKNTAWHVNSKVFFELLHTGMVCPPDTLTKDLYSVPISSFLYFTATPEYHAFLDTIPDDNGNEPDLIYRYLLTAIKEKLHEQPVALMASGGLDSSLLAALIAGELKQKLELFTVLHDHNSSEYHRTQYLSQRFGTRNHYFQPRPQELMQHIDQSILCGESEMVGILSVNAALEYLFAQYIHQHNHSIFTGDDNGLTPAAINSYSPGYYHLKYHLTEQANSAKLLSNYSDQLFAFMAKNKPFLHAKEGSVHLKHYRLDMHATMIGKIYAKYRSANYIMPFNHYHYRKYINGLNYYNPKDRYEYRKQLKAIASDRGLLPEYYFESKKRWMPAVWSGSNGESAMNEMLSLVLAPGSMILNYFNEAVLRTLLTDTHYQNRLRLLLACYYLERWLKLFQLQG